MLVLDQSQILQKVKRIAFQVYENNFAEEEIIIAGIEEQGYIFAQMLLQELSKISPLKLKLVKVSLDKQAKLQPEIKLDCNTSDFNGKTVILADDVLNTGKTLVFSLRPFLQHEVKKIEIAVLVNRSHTIFPVQASYTGYELATTLSDHIRVVLQQEEKAVYLQ